ncbi:MAG: hypothetical protein IJT59_04755 [Desulfovibrionaceae bacterium]|nr:hypothetical protein [Desulfovibrionaceae bacterium]
MEDLAIVLPSYAADTSGVASALYELGGLTVIHDASGCNSTYSTFDEPRWFTKESAIFISGLTEMEAILGQDERLINDVIAASQAIKPKFITLAGSPMPHLLGTDFKAIANIIEEKTSLPTINIPTNGINTYAQGLADAWRILMQKLQTAKTLKKTEKKTKTEKPSINLLGTSPLDQSQELIASLKDFIGKNDFNIQTNLSFDFQGKFQDLTRITLAKANLVLSASALPLAQWLYETFEQPYVVGWPFGHLAKEVLKALSKAINDQKISYVCAEMRNKDNTKPTCLLIGESVLNTSIACALELEFNIKTKVITISNNSNNRLITSHNSLSDNIFNHILSADDCQLRENESAIAEIFSQFKHIVADPIYKMIANPANIFHPLGHLAFSGRLSLEYPGDDLLLPSLSTFFRRSLPC